MKPPIKEIKEKLGTEDNELAARIQLLVAKLNISRDVLPDLHDLVYYKHGLENDPRKTEIFSIADLLLFVIYKAREVNDEPRVDARWRPIKVTDNVIRDLRDSGFQTPLIQGEHYLHGVFSGHILGQLKKLESEGYLIRDKNPATFRLTAQAISRINNWLIPRFYMWPSFLKLLNKSARYWLVAAYVAPKQVKRLSKIRPLLENGQTRLEETKSGEAADLKSIIDSRVLPRVKRLEEEERPPIDSLDDLRDEGLSHPEIVKNTLDEMLRKSNPPVYSRQFPGLVIRNSEGFFPALDGQLTNYHIALQNASVEHFKFILSVAGEFKSKKIVMGSREYSMLRKFDWIGMGISVFLYLGGEFKPMGESQEIREGDRVLIFFLTDDEAIEESISTLSQKNVDMVLCLIVCKSWPRIQKWRRMSILVKAKAAPHSIAYSLCGKIPSADIGLEIAQFLARRDKKDLAAYVGRFLKRSEFGYFISPRGNLSELFPYEKQLRSDLLEHYQRLLKIAFEEINEASPEILIVSRDVDLAGQIGEFLSIPIAKLIMTQNGPHFEFQGTVYTLEGFMNVIGNKKLVYVSFLDSRITDDIFDILGVLKTASELLQTYVLFDMLEVPWDEREFFNMRSALGLAEVWLVPEFSRMVEEELSLRSELADFSAKELAKYGRVPSVHEFPPLYDLERQD